MNRITAVIAILVLIPSYQLHSTSVMAFGTGNLLSNIPEYLDGANSNNSMFLWMFHPQNYNRDDLPRGFPVDYFMVLSDRQIKFLRETSLTKIPDISTYTFYLKNIKSASKELLKDELEFIMMVYLFRRLKSPKDDFRKYNPQVNEDFKNIQKDGGIEEKVVYEVKSEYLKSLKIFLKDKATGENQIKDQYLDHSSAIFYAIDAYEIIFTDGKCVKEDANHFINEEEKINGSKSETNGKETPKKTKIEEMKEEDLSTLSKHKSEEVVLENEIDNLEKIYRLVLHISKKISLGFEKHKDIIMGEFFEVIKDTMINNSSKSVGGIIDFICEKGDSDFKLLIDHKMNNNKKKFYSVKHDENKKAIFNENEFSEWTEQFVKALSSESDEIKQNFDNSNENILKKVISESLLHKNFEKIETNTHEIDDIAHRRYYAYSSVSEALVILIQEICNKFPKENKISETIKLFTLISAVLEDYLTFYPVLLKNDNNLAMKTFAQSLLLNVNDYYIDLFTNSPKYKENTEIAFRVIVLFAICSSGNLTKLIGQVKAPILLLSLLHYPSIQNSDSFIKTIHQNESSDVELKLSFIDILDKPAYNCEKIFEEISVDRDANIKSCETIKKRLRREDIGMNTKEERLVII
jgi:hypothetical protein